MAPPLLRAVAPTPFVTIQDGGRRGWRRFGLSVAGAMDRTSLAIANWLVGNRPGEAALEFAYAGGDWIVEAPSCRIGVAGGAFNVSIDGAALPPFSSAVVRNGQQLRIGGSTSGVWGYLAIAGGFDIPMQFGSRATHQRTGIGGIAGSAISAGEAVPLRAAQAPNEPERFTESPAEENGPFRVVLGPQQDYFDDESIARFLSDEYSVTWQQDRMAYRLDGPSLRHQKGYNIISEGVVPGCIQVPGTGFPLVLMRDCPTVGGYPKVATIVEGDLERLAQRRPGAKVRFQAISVMEAHAVRQRHLARLALIAEEPAGPWPERG